MGTFFVLSSHPVLDCPLGAVNPLNVVATVYYSGVDESDDKWWKVEPTGHVYLGSLTQPEGRTFEPGQWHRGGRCGHGRA